MINIKKSNLLFIKKKNNISLRFTNKSCIISMEYFLITYYNKKKYENVKIMWEMLHGSFIKRIASYAMKHLEIARKSK